jgi:hypothetical protein
MFHSFSLLLVTNAEGGEWKSAVIKKLNVGICILVVGQYVTRIDSLTASSNKSTSKTT